MADPDDIYAWRRLDAQVTSSGHVTEAQFAALPALGVRHVVNLALPTSPKALPDERGTVEALGMTYLNIPVEFSDPTEADYAAFKAAMDGFGDEPVHVHCVVNARVSAFLYRYRRGRIGEAAARADLDAIWQPDGVWAEFITREG